MKRFSLFLTMVLFSVGSLLAQSRTITGTVTDPNGETLIGATVQAKATTVGTVTDIDGNYSLDVPEGTTTIVFSYTGFNTQELELGVSNQLNVTLKEGLDLNEVVVTGLGIKKEKKALGYGVSTIGSSDISLRAETDVARILRGKATGVDITQTSGMAGSGTNVIIRGYSSISGSNQPLFVVDGVPFNTDTNSDRGFATGGATASSRFLDLDPNNIAEISILKGLSATVLYGESGRNGVVLITTKNGSDISDQNKKTEISLSQSISFTEVSNLPDYQNTFGNGFSGNFGWFFSNWGPAFDVRGSNGIAADGTVAHPLDQAQYNGAFPEFIGAKYDYKPYESVEGFFDKGLVSNTSVSISKNLGSGSSISANYTHLSDGGFTPKRADGSSSNVFTKDNFGLGARTELANGLKVKGTFNYVDTYRDSPPAAAGQGSNPSGQSLFANLIYTPRSIDLLHLPFQSPVDGSMAYYRRGSAIQNPLWTLNNANDNEKVKRFFSTIDLSYQLTDWLTATYRMGVDQYTQQQRRTVNKGGSQTPNGQLFTSERLNTISDQVFNLLFDFRINDDFEFSGLLGGNIRRETRDRTFSNSTNQFVFGLFEHSNFISHTVATLQREENTIGAYGTATLGYKSYLYLGLQARNDWTSTLEKDNHSIFYPSVSLSFVPTDAIQALQNNSIINYLKLRLGYGSSAGYPNPYQTRNILAANTAVFVTQGGTTINNNTVSDQLGNPNLRPELHKELEFGIEGRFLSNRVGIDISLYDKTSSDLIINLALDNSTGYTNTTVNAAEIQNRGIEAGLTITPFRKKFVWDINLNFTKNENIVNEIAEGVDQVQIPRTAFGTVANWAVPGQPYGVLQGSSFQRLNGERLVQSNGTYVVNNTISPIGNPNPDWTGNLINTLSYKNLAFSFHWNYVSGGDIFSQSTATLLSRGNTVDTDVDRFLPIIQPGVKADGTPNDIQGYMGDFFFNSYLFADEGTIFDGTTLRLREIALSYSLPQEVLANSPFGSASVRISGENLWYRAYNFPKGVNFDPEVLSVGVGNGRGLEFITGPTAKKYGISLNVTF